MEAKVRIPGKCTLLKCPQPCCSPRAENPHEHLNVAHPRRFGIEIRISAQHFIRAAMCCASAQSRAMLLFRARSGMRACRLRRVRDVVRVGRARRPSRLNAGAGIAEERLRPGCRGHGPKHLAWAVGLCLAPGWAAVEGLKARRRVWSSCLRRTRSVKLTYAAAYYFCASCSSASKSWKAW